MKNYRMPAAALLVLALVMACACVTVGRKEADTSVETDAAVTEEQNAADDPAGDEDAVPEDDPAGDEDAVPEDDPDAPQGDAEADTAPDFTVLDENGKQVRLSDLFGKPVLINFWATWCPPCKAELPHFEEAFQTYGDDLVFMMVDITDGVDETVDIVRTFMEENHYTFPVYYDTQLSAARAYAIQAIPQTYAIGRDGSIVMQQTGSMSKDQLKKFTDVLLPDD